MSELTRILKSIEAGDPHAAEQLLPLVYDELRKLAAAKMAREKPGQTLQATALVHEAYLRLVAPPASRERERPEEPRFNSRGHFFAAAGEAMRRILVERARAKKSAKRGGERKRLDLNQIELSDESKPDLLIAIHEALDILAEEDDRLASLVKLRCFVGFTLPEAADALNIARSTAIDDWAYAKSRLRVLLSTAD